MNPKPLLFALTRQIIEKAEMRLLNFKSGGTFADTTSRNGFFPFSFVRLGFSELMRPMFKWMVFSVVLIVATLIINVQPAIPQEVNYFTFLLCIFVPLFLVMFAVPSTFAFDTISDSHVNTLTDYITNLGFDTKEKLDSLDKCIALIAERTYARIKTFQGIVAVIWGLILFGLNQYINIMLKLAPQQSIKIFTDNILMPSLYGAALIFSIIVIMSYKKANDSVFRCLSFSIEELKYRVAPLGENGRTGLALSFHNMKI